MTRALIPAVDVQPAITRDEIGALGEALETFFAAAIANPHTRKAYEFAAADFMMYALRTYGIAQLDDIRPVHVSRWLEAMQERGHSAPTVKQRLSGLNTLFGFLAARGVMRRNPAIDVSAPKHRVRRGKTPVLNEAKWLQLIDAIDTRTLVGMRDRAMIATMTYTFARISAVATLKIQDVFHQSHRLWLRLAEKGGTVLDIPCNHNLESDLRAWMDAAGHANQPSAFLFQSFEWASPAASEQAATDIGAARRTPMRKRVLSGLPMTQSMTWEMLQRRKKRAGLQTAITNHTFRATGITNFLSNGGSIEAAKNIAGHASISTTQIYDRRPDNVTLEEVERIRFGRTKHA